MTRTRGTYPAFLSTVDTVAMGWTTYHQVVTQLSPDSWPYRGIGLLCAHPPPPPSPDGEDPGFQRSGPPVGGTAEAGARRADIWICGGADTAAQLIRKNAIDRYVVSVIPVILGEGIPLFSRGLPQQDLRLVSAAHSNGIAELAYEPR